MNDPFLILQGAQAASWLAMRGRTIGLASPACYAQGEDGEIFKVNNEICVVKGSKITIKTEHDWQESPPNGLVLHRPRPDQSLLIKDLMHHIS
ncbi:hypothetical protein [Sneathiella litorea]|uniref:Uncharacterized protein n=1 Tax=Sneathiella litorea TaxID=2606216 RepID=A0A6L8W7F9_9PROT|nr:hypothetical protein [Sneathiella litorea]MZR30310.1 hypothetical protein [Sneathiella litorea]